MNWRLLLPTFLIVATIAFLVSLGFWQLDRAEQKREIEASITRANTGVIELIKSEQDLLNKEFYEVRLQGRYLNEAQFIYDNQIVDQISGYYVLTPFILTGQSKAVMVNRGFIPWNGRRDKLADINVDSGQTEIKVQILNPIKRIELKTSELVREFPVIIQAIDFDVIEEISNISFIRIIGQLDASSADGFIRKWEPYTGSIEKHIGYAIQWFLMALVLGLIGIRIVLKQRNK